MTCYSPSASHDICCHRADRPRGAEDAGDTNYCVINAVASAFNILWVESKRLLHSVGRKKKHGYSTRLLMEKEELRAYGEARKAVWFYQEVECGRRCWRYKTTKPGMTIKTFLRKCDPNKRYIVTVPRHALAVVNGKATGEDNLNRRVKEIWEVTPKLERPGAINLPVLVKKNLTAAPSCEKVSA